MLEAFIDAPQQHGRLTVLPVVTPRMQSVPHLLSMREVDSGILSLRVKGGPTEPVFLARNDSFYPILLLADDPFSDRGREWTVQHSLILAGRTVTQFKASPSKGPESVSASREADITDWLSHFPMVKRQVGCLAFLGARMIGMEVLGSESIYEPIHRRILVRFVKEALRHPFVPPVPLSRIQEEARRVVDGIGEADRVAKRKIGAVEYWALEGSAAGEDLTYRGHLVHLSVSPASMGLTLSTGERGTACS